VWVSSCQAITWSHRARIACACLRMLPAPSFLAL
jgi:hypothetical protein